MSLLKDFIKVQRSKNILLPILQDYLLKQAKNEELGLVSRKAGVQEDARLSIACFKERIDEFNHQDPKTKDYFHPSAIGQCMRKLWFRHFEAPTNGAATPSEATKSFLTFEIGTYFHVLFQNLCQRAGVLEKREFPIQDDKLKIIGHADGVLNIKGFGRAILEIKTINSRGFAALSTGPKPEHFQQANIYGNVLCIPYTIFVYFNKDSSELKEFVVQADPKQFAASKKRMEVYKESVRTKKPPEKEGNGPSAFPCSFCEYSKVCYASKDFDDFMLIIHGKAIPVLKKKFNIKFKKKV